MRMIVIVRKMQKITIFKKELYFIGNFCTISKKAAGVLARAPRKWSFLLFSRRTSNFHYRKYNYLVM